MLRHTHLLISSFLANIPIFRSNKLQFLRLAVIMLSIMSMGAMAVPVTNIPFALSAGSSSVGFHKAVCCTGTPRREDHKPFHTERE
jgi:hypothetical protein